MMSLLNALFFGVLLILLGACSSASSTPSGSDNSPDGGLPSDDGGTPPTPDGSSGTPDAPPAPPYAGGDVTVSVAGDPTTVTGKATIHVEAATPAALSKIDVLVDGKAVGTLKAAPFDLAWDSSGVDNGAHAISATPYDLAGKTGTSKPLQITTSNFLLAGTWQWSNVTDADLGFGTDTCSSTTFTVTYDTATSVVTFPSFYVSCTAQNGAPYSSKVEGFTKTLTPADYDGPLKNTSGYTTITLSSTKLTQVQTPFANSMYTLSGVVARQ
jgi:hypothetical protein